MEDNETEGVTVTINIGSRYYYKWFKSHFLESRNKEKGIVSDIMSLT